MFANIIHGDCIEELKKIPSASIDAVITDPPYPCISRDYGTWTVPEWEAMMHAVVRECKRIVKPEGSAMFVLQPNSERVGSMRPWLWDFMGWVCREWNMVQDVYWWNFNTIPSELSMPRNGLMRPSVKALVWVGMPNCYRNQDNILLDESSAARLDREAGRLQAIRKIHPSGQESNHKRIRMAAEKRGGVTPFNILPISNSNTGSSAGELGHSAGTPLALALWWVRYITQTGGTVLDPFAGTATIGEAALIGGCNYIGIERKAEYIDIARKRLAPLLAQERMF